MRTLSRRLSLLAVAGVFSLSLLLLPSSARIAAQQQSQRPSVTATIVIREGDKVTLNRGAQDGLRKGDKLQVSHSINGKLYASGTLVITHVEGTTAEAKVTAQTGTVGPEDIAVLETAPPTPAAPARKATTAPPQKTPTEPARSVSAEPVKSASPEPARSAPTDTIRPTSSEAGRKSDTPLPLLPQFSTDKAGGVSFTLDFTNDSDKIVDTAVFRTTVRLIYDDQDYIAAPITPTGDYRVNAGKTRSFSFNLADFTLSKDKDVWPLKAGRHTIVILFGNRRYGPLKFDWRGDNAGN